MSLFSWLSQLHEPTKADHNRFEAPFLYEKGTVIESIEPGGEGVIKLQGVYWIARSSVSLQWPIPANTLVVIKERIGLTLIVEPLSAIRSTPPLPLTILPRQSRTNAHLATSTAA